MVVKLWYVHAQDRNAEQKTQPAAIASAKRLDRTVTRGRKRALPMRGITAIVLLCLMLIQSSPAVAQSTHDQFSGPGFDILLRSDNKPLCGKLLAALGEALEEFSEDADSLQNTIQMASGLSTSEVATRALNHDKYFSNMKGEYKAIMTELGVGAAAGGSALSLLERLSKSGGMGEKFGKAWPIMIFMYVNWYQTAFVPRMAEALEDDLVENWGIKENQADLIAQEVETWLVEQSLPLPLQKLLHFLEDKFGEKEVGDFFDKLKKCLKLDCTDLFGRLSTPSSVSAYSSESSDPCDKPKEPAPKEPKGPIDRKPPKIARVPGPPHKQAPKLVCLAWGWVDNEGTIKQFSGGSSSAVTGASHEDDEEDGDDEPLDGGGETISVNGTPLYYVCLHAVFK